MAVAVTKKIGEVIRRHRDIGLNDNPQFEKAHRGDWRGFVPSEICDLWPEMSMEARVMVYLMAEKQAAIRR